MPLKMAAYAEYLVKMREGKHMLQIPAGEDAYYAHWVQKTILGGHEVLVICDADGCDVQAYLVDDQVSVLEADYVMGYMRILSHYLFRSLQYSWEFPEDLSEVLQILAKDDFAKTSPGWKRFGEYFVDYQ
ncbi:MAG: hypothetical protein PUC00_04115 [Clostridiales bacterium]|nr:hypothetical protein [Clostridiales bacterium]